MQSLNEDNASVHFCYHGCFLIMVVDNSYDEFVAVFHIDHFRGPHVGLLK